MVDIVSATREGENVLMGVSPRGTLAFLRCVKAYAYLQGRNFVTPDDVKALATLDEDMQQAMNPDTYRRFLKKGWEI